MSEQEHTFDASLVSGYLDGELTQGDAQRVRLHLDECDDCQRIADDLLQLQGTTMASKFQMPIDVQWDETPQTTTSRLFHKSSIGFGLTWLLGIVAYVVWQVATDRESVRLEGVLVLSLYLGFGLVLLSVLFDRLHTRKTDPYRKVKK